VRNDKEEKIDLSPDPKGRDRDDKEKKNPPQSSFSKGGSRVSPRLNFLRENLGGEN